MEDEITDNSLTVDTMAYSGDILTAGGGSTYWASPTATYSITNGGTNITASSAYNAIAYQNAAGALTVSGDADFKGDVKIKGKSIAESIEAIEKRLSILIPDPKKLAKYEALQKAYEQYKTLEALCYGDDNE